ncbi:MAG TPA: S8 family serine peptidase, partial [Nitrolancea sp.]|nr:S8 family serine peptidase [Nitrolancea sp.]
MTSARRYLLLVLAACLALALPSGTLASTNLPLTTSNGSSFADVLVKFQPETLSNGHLSANDSDILVSSGAVDSVQSLGDTGAYRVAVRSGYTAAGVAAQLALQPEVVYAEADQPVTLDDSLASWQSTTDPGNQNWDLDAIDAQQAWTLGTGHGVVVAVLDTGVSVTHPAFAGRVLPGWNVIDNSGDTADDSGHGTFVAGLIAGAQTTNGFAGVAPGVTILPVKVLDSTETGSTASFVAGINYAVQAGAKIINLSASGATDSPALEDALANAEAHNVLVVTAAGNEANEVPTYPAAASTVLAVSATDQTNALASFSSYGPYIDIAAPGVDVTSSWWSASGGDGYTTASGSSASAPLVAGAAAIVAGLRPDLSAAQLREILTESAKDVESPGIDAQTGHGLLDVYAAARIAREPAAPRTATLSTVDASDGWHLRLTADGFTPNEPLIVWTDSAAGYRVVRNLSADDTGSLSTDLGPEWTVP